MTEAEYTDEFGAWWEAFSEAEQFCERMIPEADRIYDEHLEEIAGEVDD